MKRDKWIDRIPTVCTEATMMDFTHNMLEYKRQKWD